MNELLMEFQELKEMKENIRRSVNALELCWGCERICECKQQTVDDAAPVWLCIRCRNKFSDYQPMAENLFRTAVSKF